MVVIAMHKAISGIPARQERLPRYALEELKHKLLIRFVTAQRGEVLAMTTILLK